MKKIVIIGAGISGLSAGIYARRAGFDTLILEKNGNAGGLCSSWQRDGYTVDNCIHWLGGTQQGHSHNVAWREVGVLSDENKPIARSMFYSSVLDGKTVTLWRDPERSKREMLELSPEDKKEIDLFFDNVELVAAIMNRKHTGLKAGLKGYVRGRNRLGLIDEKLKVCKLNLHQYADRFSSPLLRQLILDFTAPEYEAYWLFLSYGMFVIGDADLPPFGSGGMIASMLKTYTEAGGEIRYHAAAISLEKDRKIVSGIVLAGGEVVSCDYAIVTCDLHHAYEIIGERMPKKVKQAFEKKTVTSSFQAAFSVASVVPEINDTVVVPCDPFRCGTRTIDRLWIKNYRGYGTFIAPEGQTVLQISIAQYKKDFLFWKEMYGTERYVQEKKATAQKTLEQIKKHLNLTEESVHLLDCWTPATYAARCNSFYGAYMRFLTGLAGKAAFLSPKVRQLSNLYLAGAWISYPGGSPTALLSGKKAVGLIRDREKEFK